MKYILYTYLILIAINSFIAFLLFVIDKRKAIKGTTRIKEETLLMISSFGGGLGAILGMFISNHRTNLLKKWHFYVTELLSLACNIIIILLMLYRMGVIL